MPKKSAAKPSARKLRPDVAETAFRVMMEATGQAPKTLPPGTDRPKNAEAVKRGAKGGKARKDTMTPDELAESARKAAAARWLAKPKKK